MHADEIVGAMKDAIATLLKESEPSLCVIFAHEKMDIERGPAIGVKIDCVSTDEHGFEPFALSRRGERDTIGRSRG